METLTLPSSGSIYMDTSAIIYSVERIEPYFTLLAPAWQQAETGQFAVVCSELAIAETLVRPIKEQDLDVEAAFRAVFAAPEMQMVPATRQLWEAAAHLRAETGLKMPDALHAVTAQQARCALLVLSFQPKRFVRLLPPTLQTPCDTPVRCWHRPSSRLRYSGLCDPSAFRLSAVSGAGCVGESIDTRVVIRGTG